MRYLGIDPGLSGGLAVLITGGDLDGPPRLWGAIDVPVVGEDAGRRVDSYFLRRWIDSARPDSVFIERAQAFPDQGASSGFMYGRAVGALEAVVLCVGVPLRIIEPGAWKAHFRLKGGRENKEAAREAALRLFPTSAHFLARKRDHGRAEAALIAAYGADVLELGNAPPVFPPAKERGIVRARGPSVAVRDLGQQSRHSVREEREHQAGELPLSDDDQRGDSGAPGR